MALAWAYLWIAAAAMQRGDMSLMGVAMPMPPASEPMAPTGEPMGPAGEPMDPANEATALAGEAMAPSGAPMAPAGERMAPSAPMADLAMTGAWTRTTFALHFLMWWIMMIGMMIPSSLPAILLYSRVQHHYRRDGGAGRFVAAFVAGYLLAWAAFSATATAAQWWLNAAGLLSQMSMSVGAMLGAGLFAAAGIYQLSPLKSACLRHCRAPAEFLSTHQRPGVDGAFVTGAHHGLYCVGCCWLLMALLFAGGVMNLLWVAALTVFVLLEKIVPRGHWLARASGVAMLAVAVLIATSLP